jgi:hypothetical protein
VLEPYAFVESSTFTLPEGFAVDEIPEALRLDTAFGAYSTNMESRQGSLSFTRKLVLKRDIIPVEQYTAVRKFFESIHIAEQAPVVLIKK